ncbi:hypothetical protein [Paenibacillus luteus]|uniref:hypothetical protein n=1 Tax=Paenibacillus luteus TaxID=2545753 RepID=UPI0011429A7D|nr:hypothetical protein [Paenibacillus luteus]
MNTSKRRRSKKAATAGAVLLAVMLAASACGNSSNASNVNSGNEQQGTVEESPVVSELPEESGVLEPDVSTPEPSVAPTDNSGSIEDPAAPVKVNEGTYSGQVDSHSIEVETAAGVIVLQVTDEQAGTIDALPDDAKVKFEYTEKAVEGDPSVKQNWLDKIEEIK